MSQQIFKIKYALLAMLVIGVMLTIMYFWPRRNAGTVSSSTETGLQIPSLNSRVQRIKDVPSEVKDADDEVHLQFVSRSNGWLSVKNQLWGTNDGGNNWQLSSDKPSPGIRLFEFIDSHVGWMITQATLYKTRDGGLTWAVLPQPLHSDSEGHLSSLKFLPDGQHGWLSGGIYKSILNGDEYVPSRYMSADEKQSLRGVVWFTEDGGETWRTQLVTEHWGHLTALFATDTQHAWVAGTAGVLYLADRKWHYVQDAQPASGPRAAVQSLAVRIGYPTIEPACVFFVDPTLGWLSNSNGYLAASTNGGEKWQDIYPSSRTSEEPRDDFAKLFFVDQMVGWACGYEGGLYATKDGGRSWERQNPDLHFYDISSDGAGNRWAVAKEGLFNLN